MPSTSKALDVGHHLGMRSCSRADCVQRDGSMLHHQAVPDTYTYKHTTRVPCAGGHAQQTTDSEASSLIPTCYQPTGLDGELQTCVRLERQLSLWPSCCARIARQLNPFSHVEMPAHSVVMSHCQGGGFPCSPSPMSTPESIMELISGYVACLLTRPCKAGPCGLQVQSMMLHQHRQPKEHKSTGSWQSG